MSDTTSQNPENANEEEAAPEVEAHSASSVLDLQDGDAESADGSCVSFFSIAIN